MSYNTNIRIFEIEVIRIAVITNYYGIYSRMNVKFHVWIWCFTFSFFIRFLYDTYFVLICIVVTFEAIPKCITDIV